MGGPVPNYLTLKAKGREVELGAFLSEEERITFGNELSEAGRAALNHPAMTRCQGGLPPDMPALRHEVFPHQPKEAIMANSFPRLDSARGNCSGPFRRADHLFRRHGPLRPDCRATARRQRRALRARSINFLAGLCLCRRSCGALAFHHPLARPLALAIGLTSLAVFAAFGVTVLHGTPFEDAHRRRR